MHSYLITRKGGGVGVGTVKCRIQTQGEPVGFSALEHIVHHSPSGFEFGYGGSGPADLALSIMAHYFHEDSERILRSGFGELPSRAWMAHQDFKDDFIAAIPQSFDGDVIHSARIDLWMEERRYGLLTELETLCRTWLCEQRAMAQHGGDIGCDTFYAEMFVLLSRAT